MALQGRQSEGGDSGGAGVEEVLEWLEERGTGDQVRELERYGIEAREPFGVSVGELKGLAKVLGRDHDLALGLWDTGRYEARMLAGLVDEPLRVSLSQMNAWAADFDSWALVDSTCLHLFDRTPHAWKKVGQWTRAGRLFTKRAGFALIWSLSVHDKAAEDQRFLEALRLVEGGAVDERHYVKKAVNMALRATGKRNLVLHAAAVRVAEGLAAQAEAAPRWVGTHALRELRKPAVLQRLRRRCGG